MALNDYLPNPEKEVTDAKRKLEQDTNHDSKIMYDRICKAIAAEIRSGITVAEGKFEFLYSSFISHPEGNRQYISREVQTKHSFLGRQIRNASHGYVARWSTIMGKTLCSGTNGQYFVVAEYPF